MTHISRQVPPTPPLPSLVISWNTDFLLVSKGRVGKEGKEGEGGEEAKGGGGG